MKKIVSIFIIISIFLLTGCGEEHVHSYEVSSYDESKHSITCLCGDNIVEIHKFSEWEIIEEANVDNFGKSKRACTVCGYQEYREDPKLNHTHTYGEWEVSDYPTNFKIGKIVRKCVDFPNHIEEIILPALYQFNEDYEYVVIKESTCQNNGQAKYIYTIGTQKFEFFDDLALKKHNLCIYEEKDLVNHIVKCSCGYSEYESHHFEIWNVTKEATCAEAGLKVSKCEECGYNKEIIIDKLEHNLGASITVTKPTCTTAGLSKKYCMNCDYYIDFETELIDHELGATKVIAEPTCTSIGLEERKCLYCDYVVQKEIEMLEHQMGVLEMVVEPTCTNIGVGQTKCLRCDYIVKTEYDKLNHVLTDVSINEPTCQSDGIHIKECINCDKQFKELLPKLNHNESNWIISKEPTCKENGLKIIKCKSCEELLKEVEISKLSHEPSDFVLIRETSCLQTGLKEIRCINCNELLDEEITEKKPHILSDWQTVTIASCVEAGKKVKVCTECLEEVDVEIISKLEHTQVKKESKEPTCLEEGNTEGLFCDKCGKVFVGAEAIEKVDHVYENGSCKWCEELKKIYVNYYDGTQLIKTYEYNYGDKFEILDLKKEDNYIYEWFSLDKTTKYTETVVLEEDINVYATCTTIEIENASDWELIRENPTGNFIILNDISFSGDILSPIDNFSGTINGLNHVLNDFTIKNNSGNIRNFGLFKSNSGEIKNLIITNVTFNSSATDNVGGKFCYGLIAGNNQGSIDNCKVLSGTYSFYSTCNSGNNYYYIGGIVGENAGTINGCEFSLKMSVGNTSSQGYNHASTTGNLYFAGLAGVNSGTITNSSVDNSIQTSGYVYTSANCTAYINKYSAGFVANNSGLIENCYANCSISGNVTKKSDHISGDPYITDVCGGVFVATNSGKIYSCYSSGEISSKSQSSGNFGGFIGNNSVAGDIRNCYSIAKTNSAQCSTLGGFIAVNSGTIQNSYSNNDVSSTSSSFVGGFVGKITNSGLIQKCFTNSSVSVNGGSAGFFRGYSANTTAIYNSYYSSESNLVINGSIIDRTNEDNAERAWILGVLDEKYIQDKLYFDSEKWHFTTSTPVLKWEIVEDETKSVCGSCGCVFELKDYSKEQTTSYEVTEATCDSYGFKYYSCLNCDKEITIKTAELLGHNYEDDFDGKDICTNDVLVTYTCKNCGDSYTEELKAKGHNHDHNDNCLNCGYSYEVPTCTKEGLLEYVCDCCGEEISEVLSVSHEFVVNSWETEPTCTEDGIALVICSLCQYQEYNMVIENSKLGHYDIDFDNICNRCDNAIYDESVEFIEISTVEDLKKIALDKDSLSKNYILTADIDLSNVTWEPIGSEKSPFTGFFNGNSKTIRNVPLTSNLEYSGLFGYNSGVITNLNISYSEGSFYQCMNDNLTFGAICAFNNGTINACSVNGSVKFTFTHIVELGEKGKSLTGTQDLVIGLISGENKGYIVGCNISGTYSLSFSNEANLSSEIGHNAVDMVVNAYYLGMTVNSTQNVGLGFISGINENKIANCSVDFTSCTIDNALASATYKKGKWGYLNSYANYNIGMISSNTNEITEDTQNSITRNITFTNDVGNYESSILENGKYYKSKALTKVVIYN